MLALISILPFATVYEANAGIFTWFSGIESKATTSQTIGFLTSYLSVEEQLATDIQPAKTGLHIIQNSSLASIASPTVATKEVGFASLRFRELIVSATAYSSTPDQTDDSPFITARNTHVREGIVAANFLPFGTKIKIPDIYGDRIFIVEDRMNRRYWHKIDIWFPDRQSALEFGLKTVKIQVLES